MVFRIYEANPPQGDWEREQINDFLKALCEAYITNDERIEDMYIFLNLKIKKQEYDMLIFTPKYAAILELKNKVDMKRGGVLTLNCNITPGDNENRGYYDTWKTLDGEEIDMHPVKQLYDKRGKLKSLILEWLRTANFEGRKVDMSELAHWEEESSKEIYRYIFGVPILPDKTNIKVCNGKDRIRWLYIPNIYAYKELSKYLVVGEHRFLPISNNITFLSGDTINFAMLPRFIESKYGALRDITNEYMDKIIKDNTIAHIDEINSPADMINFRTYVDKLLNQQHHFGFSDEIKKQLSEIKQVLKAIPKESDVGSVKEEIRNIFLSGDTNIYPKETPSKVQEESNLDELSVRVRNLLVSNDLVKVKKAIDIIEKADMAENYLPLAIELFKNENTEEHIKYELVDFLFSVLNESVDFVSIVERYLLDTQHSFLRTKIITTLLSFDKISFKKETFDALVNILNKSCDKSEIITVLSLLGKTGSEKALEHIIDIYNTYEDKFWNIENIIKEEACPYSPPYSKEDEIKDIIFAKSMIIKNLELFYSDQAFSFVKRILSSEEAKKYTCLANSVLSTLYSMLINAGKNKINIEHLLPVLKSFIDSYSPTYICDPNKEVFHKYGNSDDDLEEIVKAYKIVIDILTKFGDKNPKSCELIKQIFLKSMKYIIDYRKVGKSAYNRYYILNKAIKALGHLGCGAKYLYEIASKFRTIKQNKQHKQNDGIRIDFKDVIEAMIKSGKEPNHRDEVIDYLVSLTDDLKDKCKPCLHRVYEALIELKAKEKKDIILAHIEWALSQNDKHDIVEALWLITKLWMMDDNEVIKDAFNILIKAIKNENANKYIVVWLKTSDWVREINRMAGVKYTNEELFEELYGEYAEIMLYMVHSPYADNSILFWSYVEKNCNNIYFDEFMVLFKETLNSKPLLTYDSKINPVLSCIVRHNQEKLFGYLRMVILDKTQDEQKRVNALSTLNYLARKNQNNGIYNYIRKIVSEALPYIGDDNESPNVRVKIAELLYNYLVKRDYLYHRIGKCNIKGAGIIEDLQKLLYALKDSLMKKEDAYPWEVDILKILSDIWLSCKGVESQELIKDLLEIRKHPKYWYHNMDLDKYCNHILKDDIKIPSPYIISSIISVFPDFGLNTIFDLDIPWAFPCGYVDISKSDFIFPLTLSKPQEYFGILKERDIPKEFVDIINYVFNIKDLPLEEETEPSYDEYVIDEFRRIIYVGTHLWGVKFLDFLFSKLKEFLEQYSDILNDGVNVYLSMLHQTILPLSSIDKQRTKSMLLDKVNDDIPRIDMYKKVLSQLKKQITKLDTNKRYSNSYKLFRLLENIKDIERALKDATA